MVSQAASGLAWGYKAVSGPRPGCNELQGFGTNMWDLIRGHQDWWLHIRHVYFQVGSCKEGGFSCMKAPGRPPSCMYFCKIVNYIYFLIILCIHWEYMCENYSPNGPLGWLRRLGSYVPANAYWHFKCTVRTTTSCTLKKFLLLQNFRKNINPRNVIQVKPRT